MSTRTSLLKRYDELITIGKTLLKDTQAKGSSLKSRAEIQRWRASCYSILEKTFGKEHIYLRNFQKIGYRPTLESILTHGIVLMEGAKEEVEKGFLYKIERLISVDLFDTVIEQAEYLLKNGFKDVAAVLGRVVIENTLKGIAKRENITVPDKTKLSDLNQLLWKEGVYAKNVWRSTQAQIDLGNDAAHGHFDKYDAKAVGNMLTWIRETLWSL